MKADLGTLERALVDRYGHRDALPIVLGVLTPEQIHSTLAMLVNEGDDA